MIGEWRMVAVPVEKVDVFAMGRRCSNPRIRTVALLAFPEKQIVLNEVIVLCKAVLLFARDKEKDGFWSDGVYTPLLIA